MIRSQEGDDGHWEMTLPRFGWNGHKSIAAAAFAEEGTGGGGTLMVIYCGGELGKEVEFWNLSTVTSSEAGGGVESTTVWTMQGTDLAAWVRLLLKGRCVAVTLQNGRRRSSRNRSSGDNIRSRPTDSSEVIVVVATDESVDGAARYNPQQKRWMKMAPPPRCISRAAGIGIGTSLYLMGGLDEERRPTNHVSVFDANSGIWEAGPSMLQSRANFGAAALGGHVYVVGGCDGATFNSDCWFFCDHPRFGLRAAERYDPTSRTWTRLPPMRWRRSGCVAAAGVDGRLYVFGGEDDDEDDEDDEDYDNPRGNSCERYDPLTRRWESLPCMNELRSNHAAAVLGNRIFVIGGQINYDEDQLGVEIFKVNTQRGEDAVTPVNGSASDALLCPITRGIMIDPVMATDGYSYERGAIQEWFRRSTAAGELPRSPMTNETLMDTRLVRNHNLRFLCRDGGTTEST